MSLSEEWLRNSATPHSQSDSSCTSPASNNNNNDNTPLPVINTFRDDWFKKVQDSGLSFKEIDIDGNKLKARAVVVSANENANEYFLRCPCILDSFGNDVGAIYLDVFQCPPPNGSFINIGDWLHVRTNIYKKNFGAKEITHKVVKILEVIPSKLVWSELQIFQLMRSSFIEITTTFILPSALKERGEDECILESEDGLQVRFPTNRINKLIEDNRGAQLRVQTLATYTRPSMGRYEWLKDFSGKEFVSDGGLATSIDPSLDPCDDFYQFVCAGWKRSNPINDFHAVQSHPSSLVTRVLVNYNQLITEMVQNQWIMASLKREQLLWLQYIFSCANLEKAGRLGTNVFFDLKRRIKAANLQNLTDWLIFNHPYTAFFNSGVAADDRDATKNVILMAPLETIQDWSSYSSPLYRQQFLAVQKYLINLFTLFSNDDLEHAIFENNSTAVQRKVANILKVDQRLAKILASYVPSNYTEMTMPLKDITKVIKQIDYQRYFKSTIPREILEKIDIDETTIHIRNAEAVKKIDELLAGLTREEIDDFGDFVLLQHIIPFLDTRIKDIEDQYKFEALGTLPIDDTMGDCLKAGISKFPEVATTLYIERFYSQATTDKVNSIVANIKMAFLEILNGNKWMDSKTKIEARKKANVMTQFVGYNKKIFNETAVSEKYSTLIYPEPISYFGIRVTYDRWSSDRAFEKLLKGNSREDFEFLATTPNAFYMASRNSIAIPVGILQTPYFNVSHTSAQNYGAMGSIIGHEITHGFDDYGAKFDGFGNRRDWWDGKTMNSFNKMTKCFVDQYGKTKVDHLNLMINGAKTLSENIADNGGLRAAYNAFQKVLRRGEGRERPSASQLAQYSPNQLFFMGYAYVWCQSVSDQFLLANVPGDVHPPNRQRVNLVLRNLPQFSQAFKCSPKSKMIAGKKCKVW
ncbi:unnamed protein product, partial [Mesorhabditis belari]|uniref:Uncharacterized protein n=1 Tax=Mesorhabditis belari TaxID=2138241 RepID=A0AAF3JBL5_9BILA